ncbi:MAG: hypothetical protein ACOY99_06135 [Pseudomonadota bacterium]
MAYVGNFRWRWWHKLGLLFGVFYWYAFDGGLWLTVIFGASYETAYGLKYETIPPLLELFFIAAFIYLPWRWPQWAAAPIFIGTILAQHVVRGSHWWAEYWAARAGATVGLEHTFWVWSFYSSFFIYGPILAILATGWLTARQALAWARAYRERGQVL